MKRLSYFLFFIMLSFSTLFSYNTIKKPFKAGTLSFFVPGAGQLYNKSYIKATTVITLETYFFFRFLHFDKEYRKDKDKLNEYSSDDTEFSYYFQRYEETRDSRHDMIWWLGTTVFLSAVDAYVDAHLYNYEMEKSKVHLEFEGNKISLSYNF